MALRCDVCDKKTAHGNQQIHRHSVKWKFRAPKTKRTWVPNVRSVKLEIPGNQVKLSMCMSCYKKYQQIGKKFLVDKDVKAVRKLNLMA